MNSAPLQPALAPPSAQELLDCVTREVQMRRRVYPRRVEQGRMSYDDARHEIRCMEFLATRLANEIQPTLL